MKSLLVISGYEFSLAGRQGGEALVSAFILNLLIGNNMTQQRPVVAEVSEDRVLNRLGRCLLSVVVKYIPGDSEAIRAQVVNRLALGQLVRDSVDRFYGQVVGIDGTADSVLDKHSYYFDQIGVFLGGRGLNRIQAFEQDPEALDCLDTFRFHGTRLRQAIKQSRLITPPALGPSRALFGLSSCRRSGRKVRAAATVADSYLHYRKSIAKSSTGWRSSVCSRSVVIVKATSERHTNTLTRFPTHLG